MCGFDGWRRPLKDDEPDFLFHGDVLSVLVPIETNSVELALKFVGNGSDKGVVGVREVDLGAKEREGFVSDEIVDSAPDEGYDGRCIGHWLVIRTSRECIYESCEGRSCLTAGKTAKTIVCVE